jgi:predicted membrane metal-binding protein
MTKRNQRLLGLALSMAAVAALVVMFWPLMARLLSSRGRQIEAYDAGPVFRPQAK